MNSKRTSGDIKSGGSYWFASIFFIIAVIGAVMMFTYKPIVPPLAGIEKNDSLETVNSRPVGPDYPGYISRTVFIMGIGLLLTFMGVKWYRKRVKSRYTNMLVLDIIGRKYIAPKQYLLLVKIEGQKLLLGVSENSINLITALNGDDKKGMPDVETEKLSNSLLGHFNRLNTEYFG